MKSFYLLVNLTQRRQSLDYLKFYLNITPKVYLKHAVASSLFDFHKMIVKVCKVSF